MRILVQAKPSAKNARVERLDPSHFVVAVAEPPKNGEANYAILRALAGYFSLSPSRIRLVSGFSSNLVSNF